MRVFDEPNVCSGCTACMNSCPKDAIAMKEDSEGFRYPEINETICINCGICKTICPFNENYLKQFNLDTPLVYAVKNKNEDVRLSSSSGGVFTAISNYVLENGGVVYGVAFDKNLVVRHGKATNKNDRDRFKGSKYVQSDLGKIFLDIKKEIESNKIVLFTGTPCQTAGLRAFLRNKEYKNLIICDLVCAGVSTPLLWKEYVQLLSKKMKSSIKTYNFRYKGDSWHRSSCMVELENGKTIFNNPVLDIYSSIYKSHIALRPSCYNCVFTNFKRPSDLTIGDFWGVEKTYPSFDDDKGVSLVLVNTVRGKEVFSGINKEIVFKKSSVRECKQRNLTRPTPMPPKRGVFWRDYYNKGFMYVAKKYTGYGIFNRIKIYFLKPTLKVIGIHI